MNIFLFASPMLLAQQPDAGIVKLMMIIGAVLLAVAIVKLCCFTIHLLFHPHALGFFAAVAILLFLLFAFFGTKHGGMQPIINTIQPAIQEIANSVTKPQETKVAEVADQKPSTAAVTENKPVRDPNSPPTWINEPPHRQGDSYFVVVHLDADTNPTVRDEMLDAKMVLAAERYIDEHLYPSDDVSKIVKIDARYLNENCLQELYPPSGLSDSDKEAYARLEFDKKFRNEVDRRYQEIIAQDHLRRLCGIAIGGFIFLGALYFYLLKTHPKAHSPLAV